MVSLSLACLSMVSRKCLLLVIFYIFWLEYFKFWAEEKDHLILTTDGLSFSSLKELIMVRCGIQEVRRLQRTEPE